MSKKKYNLFEDFPPISGKEWKQQIQMELKGADYTDTLVWSSLEGIDVKPFYHADDYEYLEIPTSEQDFKIVQPIFVDNPAVANKLALDAISRGVDAIQFIAEQSFDMDLLLQGFSNLKEIPTIFLKVDFQSNNFIESFVNYFEKDAVLVQQDLIGHLIQSGNWFSSEAVDFKKQQDLLGVNPDKILLHVNTAIYQNAGANMSQQIAYALSHASEYIHACDKDKPIVIQFEFAIGSNYFFEIAKLRTFRYLWQQLITELGIKTKAIIIATPTSRNKTLYDYNVNMLRTTAEYMSAVLGGADYVMAQAYDHFFKKSNHFSNRIARNQLLLLREENDFKNAHSFAKGSYFIEALTLEIAKRALKIFKDVEKSGGFLSLLKSGIIQKKIQEAAQKEQDLFDEGKLSLLGSNKYPNPDDKMKEGLEVYPFLKKSSKRVVIQPIVGKRLTEKLEQIRLEEENLL